MCQLSDSSSYKDNLRHPAFKADEATDEILKTGVGVGRQMDYRILKAGSLFLVKLWLTLQIFSPWLGICICEGHLSSSGWHPSPLCRGRVNCIWWSVSSYFLVYCQIYHITSYLILGKGVKRKVD